MFQIGNVKKKENLIFNSPCQTWAEVLNSVDLTAATDKKFTNANLLHSKPEICSHIWNWKSWLEFLKWWEEFIAFKTEKPKNENKNPCCEKSWFEFLEWWEEFLLAHHRSRWIGPTPPWGISKMIDPCKHMYGFNEFVLGHSQIYSR